MLQSTLRSPCPLESVAGRDGGFVKTLQQKRKEGFKRRPPPRRIRRNQRGSNWIQTQFGEMTGAFSGERGTGWMVLPQWGQVY